MQKVGVLGSGTVGETLANGFLELGHEVMRGSRDPGKLADWKAEAGGKAATGSFEDTARFGDVVVLAVKGTAAEAVVEQCASVLSDKVVMDATNPIADAPPQNGVLSFFTDLDQPLMSACSSRRQRPGS